MNIIRTLAAYFAVSIVVFLSFQPLFAQSTVFVSPSTKGLVNMACTEGSLGSFEQLHYVAVATTVAAALCRQPHVDSAVGVWKGQAENSGMIVGCPNDKAREVGALLARYYHQKQALIFERNAAGKNWLISFHANQPLGVIGIMMAQAKVSGATVIPRSHDNLVLIVASDVTERANALTLYSSLHGQGLQEELGSAALIGDDDRAKARDIFAAIIAKAPADVRRLGNDMYSEQFEELGLPTEAH
jgi:hypothetical protein